MSLAVQSTSVHFFSLSELTFPRLFQALQLKITGGPELEKENWSISEELTTNCQGRRLACHCDTLNEDMRLHRPLCQ